MIPELAVVAPTLKLTVEVGERLAIVTSVAEVCMVLADNLCDMEQPDLDRIATLYRRMVDERDGRVVELPMFEVAA